MLFLPATKKNMTTKTKTIYNKTMTTEELVNELNELYSSCTPVLIQSKDFKNSHYKYIDSGALGNLSNMLTKNFLLGIKKIAKLEIEYHEDYFGMRQVNWIGIYVQADTIEF